MANFAEISDMEAFLQVAISGDATREAAANRALTEVTAAIRNYCHQHIEQVADDEVTLDTFGGTRIYLPELPVSAVSAVIEGGETLTADEDYRLGSHGILWRIDGLWPSGQDGIQGVTVTYTHGYAQIPDDIKAVATRAASRTYQAGLRSAESDAVLGVASKQLGDFSVAFTPEITGGGVGEGVMGASAARMLLLSEKDILDKYRVRGL